MNKKSQKKNLKKIEEDILDGSSLEDIKYIDKVKENVNFSHTSPPVANILFKLPYVEEPFVGTPKKNQKILDEMALTMQDPDIDHKLYDEMFDKIHLYIHGYLINLVLKKFPYIKGYQTEDIYQESLCALRFRAIANFDPKRGMSFINFAKLCVERHLITLLNTSKKRQKDQCINQAISLDIDISTDDSGGGSLFGLIPDNGMDASSNYEYNETLEKTKNVLLENLSELEQLVLEEFLTGAPYREMAININKKLDGKGHKKCTTKSIDNSLVRIRQKAEKLRTSVDCELLPLFLNN